jgi:hypothetical protein
MRILTEVYAVVDEVWTRLATRKRTQGTSAKSWGSCGAPPALVHLPATGVVSLLPQRQVGRGRGATKWHGGGGA